MLKRAWHCYRCSVICARSGEISAARMHRPPLSGYTDSWCALRAESRRSQRMLNVPGVRYCLARGKGWCVSAPGRRRDLEMKYLKALWLLTSSTSFTTRQTSNKLGLLSLLWRFCSYLFWPQRRPKEYKWINNWYGRTILQRLTGYLGANFTDI